MRALLVVHGSRGDVQPFLALAQGLLAHGWHPRVAAPARFAALAAEHGVAFHPLDDAALDLQDLAAKGGAAALTAARQVTPMLRRMLDTAAEAISTEPADIVVHHPKALAGPHLAEALGVPAIGATLLPLYVPTREFPLPLLPAVPGPLARASWRFVSVIDAPYASMLRTWRRDRLGLPARAATSLATAPDGHPAPVPLQAWSRHILPAPSDWPSAAAPLGFWFTDDWSANGSPGWEPPSDLLDFLDAGRPPVYVGFGSMVGRNPSQLARTVLDGVRLAGVRAVLATGWGALDPDDLPDDVFVLDQAPHSWLLPRTAAVVHHGGVGTMAAAARAGRPQVIRPFLGDQPFWARRVHGLGLGPAPLTGRLTPQRLADAIVSAQTREVTDRASTLRAQIEAEDSIGATIARLTDLVDGPSGR